MIARSDFAAPLATVRKQLQRQRLGDALRHEPLRGLPLLWLPVGVWALQQGEVVRTLAPLLAVSLLPYLLTLVGKIFGAYVQHPSAEACLGWLDQHAQLSDRLRSAYQFLGDTAGPAPTQTSKSTQAFQEAAIEDAQHALRNLKLSTISSTQSDINSHRVRPGSVRSTAAALLIVSVIVSVVFPALTTRIPPHSPSRSIGKLSSDHAAQSAGSDMLPRGEGARTPSRVPRSDLRSTTPNAAAGEQLVIQAQTTPEPNALTPSLPLQQQTTVNSSGTGGNPLAADESTSSDTDAASPDREAEELSRAATPRSDPDQKSPDTASAALSMQSDGTGAPGGHGQRELGTQESKGKSHDRGSGSENNESAMELLDEGEQPKSRGGLQPQLREQRNPPSRDLTVGRSNEGAANARGGPSPRKKSRGTASLLVTVPILDTIPAVSQAGPSKISTQHVTPLPRAGQAANSHDLASKSGEGATIAQSQLPSWQQRVLLELFRRTPSKRSAEEGSP